ncbi:MAG: NAD+ synthase [Methanothrix sp.]|jgi:NAD+ synthetase|nr:NAD+ synthase [Methanothrix sp.]
MKIKLCQLNTVVGDLEGNTKKAIQCIENSKINFTNEIIIFQELLITGYPPLDLINQRDFIKEQLKYKNKIVESTKGFNGLVVFGYIEENNGIGKDYFNSALVCHNGIEIYNYRKRLLPTYDIFDEARYFEPGKEMGLFQFKGKRIGLVVCEDLWYKNKLYTLNPAKELFNAKADFIISINASPSIVKKYAYRVNMVKKISEEYALPIIYLNSVGGNDDIIFDGNSFVTNSKGILVENLYRFEEDIRIIDLNSLDVNNYNNINNCKSDAQFYYEQAVLGIRDYVNKCGFKGVVIGESGGIDSAVVTALAVDALGADRVVAITMPSQYSSIGSCVDSAKLCKNLGVKLYTFPIGNSFSELSLQFNNTFGELKAGVTEQNMQARIRGQILMAYSNRYGYLVLSTGNKSEVSVGYTTIYGDMAGGLAPISDLYKMEVFTVAKYYNELYKAEIIPSEIINKEPSAELALNQKDTDNLPPYPILDTMLKHIIEGESLEENEKKECLNIIELNQDYYNKVLNMVHKAEFKRRQAAIGIKMHNKAFGYGRRIPIVQKWKGK